MASNQPSKRKFAFPGAQNATAASRKRAKAYDARSLAVQSADAALSASGELDVAAFVQAREFEIRALESGMQRSKSALTSRAFQKVPRALRRRTASHNVKRVPRRLRTRAKREMIEDNTPTVTARRRRPTEILRIRLETARRLQNLNSKTKAKRAAAKAKRDKETKKSLEESGSHTYDIAPRVPKIKKYKLSRPPPPDAKYKKRQRCKTWLPTHMFHAKRAHMATTKNPLWRFAIPLSSTEKSYRPSHRAKGARGAVAWDMSYMSTIQLEGTEEALEAVLRAIGVDGPEAWGLKGKKWRAGTRSLQAWAFERQGTRRPIGPITLIRCAEGKPDDVEMAGVDDTGVGSKKDCQKNMKKLFIRVHPSAFLQLWNELLELSKRQNPPVMVEDLRFEIGSIDITGPGSTETLLSALKPLMTDGSNISVGSPEATWSSLLGVSNPSSLPQNAVLGFSISDPRLHFPPRTLRPSGSDLEMQNLAVLLSTWSPDSTQTSPALFDRRARLAAARQLPSQKAINRRRTQAGPGIYPPAEASDPKIPVIILASRVSSQSKNSNAPGTWTILLPWKCVTPVWYSLVYYPLSSGGNIRFGGLKEQQQLAFEAGEPWFPGDFPGTRAGWEWYLNEREKAKTEWERRPKGRRAEFDSLDLGGGQKGEIGRGWACDWERLVQGPPTDSTAESSSAKEKEQNEDGEQKDVPTQDAEQQTPVQLAPPLNIHHLPSSKAETTINSPPSSADASALAIVRISLINRGTPTPQARIYRLPTTNPELRQKWLQLASETPKNSKPNHPRNQAHGQSSQPGPAGDEETARQRLAASLITPSSDAANQAEHLPVPPEEDLIGFVTSGNYNLSEGKGTGIGSILLAKVAGPGKGKGKVRQRKMCIIRSAGERVARLGYWELA
ncbi:ribonuclease P/MRP protein subunit POP1 [Aspergillus clavatus NRRL 1]|uniref:Ribonuclease P complex subunit Pop1, putative n=1 Tax=Aspergillus clavatus (strain ATCC 1007 / CBS 513.65 / DSM 816 / NCTC 3887 / NRRL 1 / QM 1276 / 107) TaxID=344612 RepID=A1CMU1_ASPCL|nr:ribonuclease P complex subunit Pop1, putative [Aspergillus clavatus NRRL 1]EAW08878.1 ribonuclease P complex subunit Pop1, putative [Aspergillus clavatus NRRL 1]